MSRRAMTLAELIIGLTMLSVIGLAIGGMATSLSRAYGQGESFYSDLQSARVSMMRLEAMAQGSEQLLSSDPFANSALTLWEEDRDKDGMVNLSEMVFVHFDPTRGELVEQRLNKLPDNMDFSISPSSLRDVDVTVLLMWWYGPYRSDGVLATNLLECQLRTDTQPPDTTLISLRIKVGTADRFVQLQSARSIER
ncbi:MAG: Tfp pilus assembly protein FimT/FimU [Phycisphaerae bacterium]